jgi:hypothetical protein
MNLYRLDRADGRPVRDLLGTMLIRSAADARAKAVEVAMIDEQSCTVTRISGAGSMRAVYTVHPNGRSTRI